MRLIHAVRELERRRGDGAIRRSRCYTEPDRARDVRREADEAYDRPGLIDDGRRSDLPRLGALERALVDSRADAAWVGWGFVAEHPAFAELCERLGIVFIGPTRDGDARARRQDRRQAARRGARACRSRRGAAGPWRRSRRRWRRPTRIGYPADASRPRRAAAGAASAGCDAPRGPARRFERASAEARKRVRRRHASSSSGVLAGARHVEVQVIADRHGTAWALGVRDCTIQRRHQKVHRGVGLAGALDRRRSAQLRPPPCGCAARAGYESAGTVEFLYEPDAQHFAFMEVNARLQVEHPVTEATTGTRPGEAAAPRGPRRAARGRAARGPGPRDRGPAERRGSRRAASRRRRGASSCCACPRARGSASTPASREGDVVPPSSTR